MTCGRAGCLALVADSTEDALRSLIAERDEAEAQLRRIDAKMRPLMRAWADENRQFTMPTLDQLRRELAI